MASERASESVRWHKGDICLTPDPKDGVLREATIQRLTSSSHNNDTAWVIFTDCNKDAGEKEEEAIPVHKLTRPGWNHVAQEKPLFPGSVTDPSLSVPLVLSEAEGHRVPFTINRYLRDYQRDGIRFIYKNYSRSRGCILGDDMGLGKTVQIIGFLAALLHKTGTWEDIENNRPDFLQSQTSKRSKPNKVFLIVAPLSVLYNWKDELDTWGHFQRVVVHGLRKEDELARIKKGRIEIALTTYETLRLCLDQFNKIGWCAVVVDEAHKIKNPNSQITQAMKELTCKIRIGLTGTILQNNLEELWCVMDWAIPRCLGSLGHFKNNFSDPIEHGQKHSATKRALATGRKAVRALARKLSPWFFRRTKAFIKDQLPKKDDRVVYCSLTDFQQAVYQAVLDSEDVTLLLRSSEKCDCHSGRTRRGCCYKANSAGVKIKELYFSYLAILRKAANHVALLQSTAGTSNKQKEYVSAICAKVFQKFPDFVQRCKNEAFVALSDPMYSGKMKVLQKLLKHYLQKKDKVLIFSLSTKLLDVLESYCMAEGLDFSRLDGSTNSKQRIQIVKEFNSSSDINLCLVSTMAGGLGLNFVGANVVVLFDPTWNPANDLQAIDRAYRIGQCRDVSVLRLISLGTVEEIIYLRQVYKQQLQSTVFGKESARRYFEGVQGVQKGELFGIQNLFRLQTQGTCLTRVILEREGKVEAGVKTARTRGGEEEAAAAAAAAQGTEEVSEPGVSSVPSAANKETTKANGEETKAASGVLDFSSGSEEDEEERNFNRKASNQGADGGSRSETATSGPSRASLLECVFSRLFEMVGEEPNREEGDSGTGDEESTLEEGVDNRVIDGTSSGNSSKTESGFVERRRNIRDRSCSPDRNPEGRRGKVSLLKEDSASSRRHGSKLGMNKKTTTDEESDENSSPDQKKARITKSAAHKVCGFDAYSEESDDFDLLSKTSTKKEASVSVNRGKRRQSTNVRDQTRGKYTDDIETFTSSEDEGTPPKHGRRATPLTTKGRERSSKAVSFTSLKGQTSPAANRNIDSLLGGVEEVAYIHSNQRVVGGSKAEELISRAAVRDVFERRMFSQCPANHLLSSQESLIDSIPDTPPTAASVTLPRPSVDHPATFTTKSVHHTRRTTFIIGETPQGICRQQLEEMATAFQFPSVRQFARDILSATSAQRLARLRDYYSSLNHPDLATTVASNFPQPDAARAASPAANAPPSTREAPTEGQRRSGGAQKDVSKDRKKAKCFETDSEPRSKGDPVPESVKTGPEAAKRQKISQKAVVLPSSDDPSPETEEEEEDTAWMARRRKWTKRVSVSKCGAHTADGGLGVDRGGRSGPGSGEPAAFLDHTDRDASSLVGAASKPTAQGQRGNPPAPSTSSDRSFLSDLLGDTSILDDLLKPKRRAAPQGSHSKATRSPPPAPVTPPAPSTAVPSPGSSSHAPERAAKGARKDFWDILNEGNEERINQLTDPEEVQRVCVNSSFAAKRKPRVGEEKGLWKANEKFFWKK